MDDFQDFVLQHQKRYGMMSEDFFLASSFLPPFATARSIEKRKSFCKFLANGLDLRGLLLNKCSFEDCSFEGSNLSYSYLVECNFVNCKFIGTRMLRSNLSHSSFKNCDFKYADLCAADLTGANLSGSNLEMTNLCYADLAHTNVEGATFDRTMLASNYMHQVINFDKANIEGHISVSMDNLTYSSGMQLEMLIKNADIPEEYARHILSLLIESEYYSCFISYSSSDSDFVERLSGDLERIGVTIWRDVKDLKIGDPIREMIQRGILLHERMLVVLSTDSINSNWVEDEIETCFEKERKGGGRFVLPITVDDTIFETDRAWAASLRRKIKIGDFRNFGEAYKYEEALSRLASSLKK